MFPLDPPKDEIGRVLAHPLPPQKHRFNAVLLRERLAGSLGYPEKDKHVIIENFSWMTAREAASIRRLLRKVEDVRRKWFWVNVAGLRRPLDTPGPAGPVAPVESNREESK